MAGQTYSKNQFGEAQIDVPLPIGGSNPSLFPIMVAPNGQKFFTGLGAPTVSAAANDIYIRQDGSGLNQVFYICTGTTNWTAAALTGGAAGLATALTGFTAGAGTVSASDTILTAFNKLAGNTQNLAVTANLLTGLAAGANTPIAAGNTILVALANLQAQINAL